MTLPPELQGVDLVYLSDGAYAGWDKQDPTQVWIATLRGYTWHYVAVDTNGLRILFELAKQGPPR